MKGIPTLKGKEAEDFIKKADNALCDEKTDFSKQSESCKRILRKSKEVKN